MLHPRRWIIQDNSGIRRFIWEHFINLNWIEQCMKYCGGTFSRKKLWLCIPKFWVIGHCCTYIWGLSHRLVANHFHQELGALLFTLWGSGLPRHNRSPTDCNFAHCAHQLVKLTCKGVPFEFGKSQATAQEGLKDALIHSPALWAIDYTSDSPVILAVNASHIAVSFFLCQCNPINSKVRHYSC